MVFFTDRDLGRLFPGMLRKAGIEVESHGDHFQDDVRDEVWIMEAGRVFFCIDSTRSEDEF